MPATACVSEPAETDFGRAVLIALRIESVLNACSHISDALLSQGPVAPAAERSQLVERAVAAEYERDQLRAALLAASDALLDAAEELAVRNAPHAAIARNRAQTAAKAATGNKA